MPVLARNPIARNTRSIDSGAVIAASNRRTPTGTAASRFAEHPRYAFAIHNWLVAAGVTVGDWHGGEKALPRRLGAHLLQAVIGHGGFGTVDRAEQQEPIRRPVANGYRPPPTRRVAAIPAMRCRASAHAPFAPSAFR